MGVEIDLVGSGGERGEESGGRVWVCVYVCIPQAAHVWMDGMDVDVRLDGIVLHCIALDVYGC